MGGSRRTHGSRHRPERRHKARRCVARGSHTTDSARLASSCEGVAGRRKPASTSQTGMVERSMIGYAATPRHEPSHSSTQWRWQMRNQSKRCIRDVADGYDESMHGQRTTRSWSGGSRFFLAKRSRRMHESGAHPVGLGRGGRCSIVLRGVAADTDALRHLHRLLVRKPGVDITNAVSRPCSLGSGW